MSQRLIRELGFESVTRMSAPQLKAFYDSVPGKRAVLLGHGPV